LNQNIESDIITEQTTNILDRKKVVKAFNEAYNKPQKDPHAVFAKKLGVTREEAKEKFYEEINLGDTFLKQSYLLMQQDLICLIDYVCEKGHGFSGWPPPKK